MNPSPLPARSVPAALVAVFVSGLLVSPGLWAAEALAWDYWTPRSELPEAVAGRVPPFCAGAYRWPVFPAPSGLATDEEPVAAQARRLEYWESGPVILEGDVTIQQGRRTLLTDRAELDHETRQGRVPGVMELLDPQAILRGEDAAIDFDTRATELNHAEFLLIEPEFRGQASRLIRNDHGDLAVVRGSFTRCEPGNNNWRVSARSFTIRNGSDFGTARHAVVRVKDVPVFYFPYLSFPVNDERKSGWLFPSIGLSSQNGFEFAPPYYFNLAPNYDATVVPRYYARRGLGIEGEFRHLSRWQKSRIVGAFLGSDDAYDGNFDKDDFDDLVAAGVREGTFEPADRWLYGLYHEGDLAHWHSTVDYTAVSDRDYFRHLDAEVQVASRRELERFGELRYERGGLDVRLWGQRFQRLDNIRVDPYARVPELSLSYRGELPGPFEWSFGGAGAYFDRRNDDLAGIARIVGSRVHLEPRLSLPLDRPWGFLRVTGGYRYTAYDLDDVPVGLDDTPERRIGMGSADAGLFFERDYRLFGRTLTHTLEPRLYYLYQEFEAQDDLPRFDSGRLTFRYDQLWRDNRFTGLDRIGDANQLAVGLTSRLLDAASGRERLRASIGQIRYLEDRRVTLAGRQGDLDQTSGSEVAAELVGRFGPWSAGGDLVWSPADDRVARGGGFFAFRTDNDHIAFVGHRFQRGVIEQSDAGFIWPLSRRYSLIGRWNYDLRTKRTIEGLLGIEYNDCCWKLRLVARNYLDTPSAALFDEADRETGIFFQVVFKGLASLDDSLENLLSESIRGYAVEE